MFKEISIINLIIMDKKKGSRDPEKFIEQFVLMIKPHIYDGCKGIYNEAITNGGNEGMKVFMICLKGVPNWSDNILDTEVRRITHETKMGEYLEKLFNIIMKTTILNMTGIPNSKKHEIECPPDITLKKCIHKIYTKVAEEVFLNPQLFNNEVDEQKIGENEILISNLINKSIRDSIAALTPIEYILDNYHGLDTEVSEKKPPIIIQQGGAKAGIQFTPYYSEALVDDNSIQDLGRKTPSPVSQIQNKHPIHTSDKVQHKSSESRVPKTISSERRIKSQPLIKVSEIKSNVQESEAYHKYNAPPIDVFSNKVYTNERTITPSVNTDEIKRYALNQPKKETDNNTSIKNYVPSKKINNTRI